jgi:integrase
MAGLCVRVQPSGRKAWCLRVRANGILKRFSLGEYPATSLSEARDMASEMKKAARRGQNPEHILKPPLSHAPTMRAAVKDYMETKEGNQSHNKELRRLENHILPTLGDLPVDGISKADIDRALQHMVRTHNLQAAPNRAFTSLSGFWRWAVFQRGYRTDNPMEGMKRPIKLEPSAARQKGDTATVLDLEELVRLYHIAPGLPSSVLPDLVRCLVLVPLRREELTGLLWSEFEEFAIFDGYSGPLLRIAAHRTKARRPAIVPVSHQIANILVERRRLNGNSPYVFSVPGSPTPFGGWAHGIRVLRTYLASTKPWTVHDIRRSVATALSRDIRTDTEIIRRILQHSDGKLLGVTAIYQKSRRLKEQADALESWAALLERLAGNPIGTEARHVG